MLLQIATAVGALLVAASTSHAHAQDNHARNAHAKPQAVTVIYAKDPLANIAVLAADSGRVHFVPISKRRLTTARLSINHELLKMGEDYVPFDPGYNVRLLNRARLIYGGDIEDTLHQISPEQATDRAVVFSTRNAGVMMLTVVPNGKWSRAAGVMTINSDSGFNEVKTLGAKTSTIVWPESFVERVVPVSIAITERVAEKLFGKPLKELEPGDLGGYLDGEFTYEAELLRGH
jgi:hypothetical protein